jgi:hypothetical protein
MVLHYLGRYTYRVAISNQRLVSLTGGQVTFRWRDSAHHNEQKLLSLSVDEFLCRFLLHILPKGFVRIRSFGFLANRKRATLLPLSGCGPRCPRCGCVDLPKHRHYYHSQNHRVADKLEAFFARKAALPCKPKT